MYSHDINQLNLYKQVAKLSVTVMVATPPIAHHEMQHLCNHLVTIAINNEGSSDLHPWPLKLPSLKCINLNFDLNFDCVDLFMHETTNNEY